VADQPAWKRDIVIFAWAAMADITNDTYLRETDMPMWLDSLLGQETTAKAEHVSHALRHMSTAFRNYPENANARTAAELADAARRRA
jgi:hypothetical protein